MVFSAALYTSPTTGTAVRANEENQAPVSCEAIFPAQLKSMLVVGSGIPGSTPLAL